MNRYDFIGIGFFCLFLVAVSWIAGGLGMAVSREINFYLAPIDRVRGKLISAHFTPHSRSSSYVPVYTGKGIGHGMSISTTKEQYCTVWDCGPYGRIGSSDPGIFRFAQEYAVLLVKCVGNEARIVGIENE